jgi:hypothetical protein
MNMKATIEIVQGDELIVRATGGTDDQLDSLDRAARAMAAELGGMILDIDTNRNTYRERIGAIA